MLEGERVRRAVVRGPGHGEMDGPEACDEELVVRVEDVVLGCGVDGRVVGEGGGVACVVAVARDDHPVAAYGGRGMDGAGFLAAGVVFLDRGVLEGGGFPGGCFDVLHEVVVCAHGERETVQSVKAARGRKEGGRRKFRERIRGDRSSTVERV